MDSALNPSLLGDNTNPFLFSNNVNADFRESMESLQLPSFFNAEILYHRDNERKRLELARGWEAVAKQIEMVDEYRTNRREREQYERPIMHRQIHKLRESSESGSGSDSDLDDVLNIGVKQKQSETHQVEAGFSMSFRPLSQWDLQLLALQTSLTDTQFMSITSLEDRAKALVLPPVEEVDEEGHEEQEEEDLYNQLETLVNIEGSGQATELKPVPILDSMRYEEPDYRDIDMPVEYIHSLSKHVKESLAGLFEIPDPSLYFHVDSFTSDPHAFLAEFENNFVRGGTSSAYSPGFFTSSNQSISAIKF